MQTIYIYICTRTHILLCIYTTSLTHCISTWQLHDQFVLEKLSLYNILDGDQEIWQRRRK